MLRRALSALLILAGFAVCSSRLAAQDLTIASASDLQVALPQIVSLFERQTGHSTRVTFGSSGNFFSQIQNGAPFDVFLSADIDYPRRLERAGLVEPGTLYPYATGRIVLWTPKASGIDLRQGLQALLGANVTRIAIANPEHAPYGRAAVAALRAAGVYDRVQPKLVLGDNIAQAAQFVQSGNAQAGIIALSTALAPAMTSAGGYVDIPSASYPPIEQAAVVLKGADDKVAALAFLEFFRTPAAASLLAQFGFDVPRPPAGR